ncbi:MAG TPA: hypothetical protein VF411_01070 [Bacteroidia bacterium]
MKKQFAEDLRNIIEMFMPYEKRHYRECNRVAKRTHILNALKRVNKVLNNKKV